jgi:anti-anti-sigma regulatory factor
VSYEVSTDSDGTVTVRVTGDLDARSVPALEAALAPTLAAGPDRIIVDAGALEFADSSAIALLVRWAQTVRELEIRDPPSRFRGLILRMGLAPRLRIGSTPDAPAAEHA